MTPLLVATIGGWRQASHHSQPAARLPDFAHLIESSADFPALRSMKFRVLTCLPTWDTPLSVRPSSLVELPHFTNRVLGYRAPPISHGFFEVPCSLSLMESLAL
jgi:hypothetical protein